VAVTNAGVENVLPDPSSVPSVAASYHSKVPPAALAVNFADVPGQTEVPLAVGADGNGFTVTVTGVRELVQLLAVLCT
jgi:hypothetical protein